MSNKYCRERLLEVPRIRIVTGTLILHGFFNCNEPLQSGEAFITKSPLHGFRVDCLIKLNV